MGEVLGCTAPLLEYEKNKKNIILFICDGRFHTEGAMI